MISRPTAFAVVFAVLATATLAFATPEPHARGAMVAAAPPTASAQASAVVHLPRVEVIGQRTSPR